MFKKTDQLSLRVELGRKSRGSRKVNCKPNNTIIQIPNINNLKFKNAKMLFVLIRNLVTNYKEVALMKH